MRRQRIWITRSISCSRPTSGSSLSVERSLGQVTAELHQMWGVSFGAGASLEIRLTHEVVTDVRKTQPAIIENLSRNRILFSQQSQKKMFSADMAVAESFRFFRSEREDSFGFE